MEKNEGKLPVVCTLDEGDRQALDALRGEQEAHGTTAQAMIRELQKNLSAELNRLQAANRELWGRLEKKYGLDPRKCYEVVRTTGEIVEHVHQHQGVGVQLVPLTEFFRAMGAKVEVEGDGSPGEPPADKSKLN